MILTIRPWCMLLLIMQTCFFYSNPGYAVLRQSNNNAGPLHAPPREHLSFDRGWRFAPGHAWDPGRDFSTGTGSFSYLAKTGYGDGAASAGFDDRAWRMLDLPHDWAAELPFNEKGTLSHGSKAIGRNFPENSIGWYRKTFTIPATDLGRQISIAFDGITRNSQVWINGHYLGTHASGYTGFSYTLSEYLNYGGENTLAVRADATIEEGWFYEGAGIYRHVWLDKTAPLHLAANGLFVTTRLTGPAALISVNSTVTNEDKTTRSFVVQQQILDSSGRILKVIRSENTFVQPFKSVQLNQQITLSAPIFWSVERPYLHQLVTTIEETGKITDQVKTSFGIRTLRFDANSGFFLNGKHVELKGTNDHQDHAGVGTALPDALQEFRIRRLKDMGCNAYRSAHNPPTPELLDVCDRLGMLVIDENRQMGVSSTQLNDLDAMILRDRNHPSIISWSVGNEEWAIEGSITGARIASTMQAYVKSIDSSRFITAALSGGIGYGISTVIDVLGYNYVATKNTDLQHQKFPAQRSWGTEEGSTVTSRGVYQDDSVLHQLAAYDRKQNHFFLSIENGWKHYASRPYLAGMFIWAGFDYRGEPTPFSFPSIESYHGMLDACGFAKDDYYYLQSWWGSKPVLHLFPHWNWAGREGQLIPVWVYSNCDEVELFLNQVSQGRYKVEVNGHLAWNIRYQPGILEARGYRRGVKILTDRIETTGQASAIKLSADRSAINADGRDLAVITVELTDKNGLHLPTATDQIIFTLDGPGRIVGVGNGNQTSLEPDQYHEKFSTLPVEHLKEQYLTGVARGPAAGTGPVDADFDDATWQPAFKEIRDSAFGVKVKKIIYSGTFTLPEDHLKAAITLFYNSLGSDERVFVNGKLLTPMASASSGRFSFSLDPTFTHAGVNSIAVTATPFLRQNIWASVNTNPGLVQLVYPAPAWKRKLFSGYAQVLVQSAGDPGSVVLHATAPGLISSTAIIKTR